MFIFDACITSVLYLRFNSYCARGYIFRISLGKLFFLKPNKFCNSIGIGAHNCIACCAVLIRINTKHFADLQLLSQRLHVRACIQETENLSFNLTKFNQEKIEIQNPNSSLLPSLDSSLEEHIRWLLILRMVCHCATTQLSSSLLVNPGS